MSSRSGRTDAPLPEARVLGWLLATQNHLQVLPTEERLGEFIAGVFRDVPGVSAAGLCFPGDSEGSCEGRCEALAGGYTWRSPGACALPDGAVAFALQTSQSEYGRLVIEVSDDAAFTPYKPFLANFAGALTLLLENRRQRRQLEDALERLKASEAEYRQLFREMAAGLAVHEIITDAAGRPCDYRFLQVNPAFETLTGLRGADIIGKRVLEFLPGLEDFWIETYGGVALTGRPVEFEHYSADLDRHYQVVAYRPRDRQFAAIFTDVTRRVRMEEALRKASDDIAAANQKLEAQNEELAAQSEELEAQNRELQSARDETARLFEEQGRLLQRLQESLLDIPRGLPGVEFAHLYRSATSRAQVGGDFYDVFEAKQDRVGMLIGDVSGHGVEAARVATLVKDTVHAFAHQFRRPHLVLRETNRLLVEKGSPGFVTAFLGFLDPQTGTFTYSSAGHPAPLIAAGGPVKMLEAGSPPLGVFPDARYRDSQADLEEGSLLLLYTDGITEARRDGDSFGEERLAECLRLLRDLPVEGIPSRLLEEALGFSRGLLRDDVALLAVNYVGRPDHGNDALSIP